MAHVITETPTFDPTITVPDGTDSRVDAAEKVAAIAQVLGNRTYALKQVTDHTAVTNAPNTFTAPQTFNAGLVAQAVQVAGFITTNGAITATGPILANGGISAGDHSIELSADVAVSGKLNANAGIGAADGVVEIVDMCAFAEQTNFAKAVNLATANDITYGPSVATQPQRLVNIDISRARVQGIATTPSYQHVPGYWDMSTAAATTTLEIPIILPRGVIQWSYQVMWSAHNASFANEAYVVRWTRDWSTGSAVQTVADGVRVGNTLATTVFTSVQNQAVVDQGDMIGWANDPSVDRWAVIVTMPKGNNNKLWGLRLQFWDPGPRNG